MRFRRTVAIAAGAVVIGAAGGAYAATRSGGNDPEPAIIQDAAGRLGVTPDKLTSALSAAEDAQLQRDVAAGRLTQAEADRIKAARAKSGHVLGPVGVGGPHFGGPGGPHFGNGPTGPTGNSGFGFGPPGFMGHGFGPFGDVIKAVTDTLGIDQQTLFTALRKGTTLSDLAKAHGKTLDDIKTAVRTAAKTDLDKAVTDGHMTQDQENQILDRISSAVDNFGNRSLPMPGSFGGHFPGRRGGGFFHHP